MTGGGGTYLSTLLVVPTHGPPTLRIAELPQIEADKFRSLAPGAMGAWEVRAYDAQRRIVAKSPQVRNFVVAPRKNKL